MYVLLILILILIILIYFLPPSLEASNKKKRPNTYAETFGHSQTNIQAIINNEQDPFVLGEIYSFNMARPDIGAQYYDMALQQAMLNSYAPVLDRLYPDTYIKPVAPNIRSDPQNVHDSNVVRQVAEKFGKLEKVVNNDLDPLFSKCKTHEKGAQAMQVITRIAQNPSYSSNIDSTDYECLLKVCERARILNETKNNSAIYEALICNLANCIENDDLVCVSGRVANIMDSLTLLDPELGTPLVTIEIARKEIMLEAAKFLDKTHAHADNTLSVDTVFCEICDELEQTLKSKFTNVDTGILNKLIEEAKQGIIE